MLDQMKEDPGSDLNNVTVGYLATMLSERLDVSREEVKGYINVWTLVQHGIPEESITYVSLRAPVPTVS